jgi:glycosyltransferase involved in cell wall biosynthesis
MIKILYVDFVGPFGGASRSLIETLNFINKKDLEIYFVCTKGSASDHFIKFSKDYIKFRGYFKFDNTKFSRYVSFRWFVLIREIFYLPNFFLALIISKIKWKKFDIIHINEIHFLFFGICAKILLKAKLVVHVRSVQNEDSKSLRTRFISYLLKKFSDAIICIDDNVKSSLLFKDEITVIHNSFFHSGNLIKKEIAFLNKDELVLGFVGNIHKAKGVFEIIEALNLLNKENLEFKMIFLGGVTAERNFLIKRFLKFFNFEQNSLHEIKSLVDKYLLSNKVIFLAPSYELGSFFNKIDILLFPSYYDAPGRPIFEAASYGIPSIASISRVFDDTFVNYDTGICVLSDSIELAHAITYFYNNRTEILRMGSNAHSLSLKNFDPKINSDHLYNLYLEILMK